jgi:hypothetical protein
MPLLQTTVLREGKGKPTSPTLNTLQYLFDFLNAYDFASESSEEIQEERKTLINASVLGLIFEKINGYKDGSIFTPGFITMYMCRQAVRQAISLVQPLIVSQSLSIMERRCIPLGQTNSFTKARWFLLHPDLNAFFASRVSPRGPKQSGLGN